MLLFSTIKTNSLDVYLIEKEGKSTWLPTTDNPLQKLDWHLYLTISSVRVGEIGLPMGCLITIRDQSVHGVSRYDLKRSDVITINLYDAPTEQERKTLYNGKRNCKTQFTTH